MWYKSRQRRTLRSKLLLLQQPRIPLMNNKISERQKETGQLTKQFLANFLAVIMMMAPLWATPLLLPNASAFGGLTDEAVTVWQHRESPEGWDIWYSALGRTGPSAPLTWHATGGPVPEAAPIAIESGDDKNPHVSINAGVTLAVWQHAHGTGSSPGDWDISYAQLNGATGVWTTPAHIAVLTGDDYDPNVAVDSNGNALAVWVHRNADGSRQLFYAVKAGASWSTPAAVGLSNGQVSLPEVSITSIASIPGPLAHRAVAAWSDLSPVTGTHRMFYSIFDGVSWTPPAEIESLATGVTPSIFDVGFANYVGTDPDPYGAFGRAGVTADGIGNAYVVWGGGPNQLGIGSPGVVGAILNVGADTWTPMLTPFGGRFIGIGGCENPDDAMTTATGDFVGVFNFAGIIEHTFRTGGAFTPESFSYDSELLDFRPSNAGLSATEMVGVNYGASSFVATPAPDPLSDIIFSIAAVTPGSSVTWAGAQHLVPGGLPGEDLFPEVASGFAGAIIQPGLTLSPAAATNNVGTPHTVTATVTADGTPKDGVTVNFVVVASGGSTPIPSSGTCVTGTTGPGQCTFTYTSPTAGSDTIEATATVDGKPLSATATKTWVTVSVPTGRMTGGGSVFTDDGRRVTYGDELHCASAVLPNNLQINWRGEDGKHHRFHLDVLTTAVCSDDPFIDPGQPPANFDTIDFTGTGSFDGQPGAIVSGTLKDAGEPGTNDFTHFHVNAGITTVLSVTGNVDRGNNQAHPN